MAILEVQDLYVGYYRDLFILHGVDLTIQQGQITAVLGANGVGKSTLLKAIYGLLKPQKGRILLEGQDITRAPTHKLINYGISYIPQRTSIFADMSVHENLKIGAWTFRHDQVRIARKIEENFERFPMLRERHHDRAGNLSGGMQRMVEVARTLMTDPKVILVDEPTAGLAKLLSQEVYEMLVSLRDRDGLTIVLVDQEIREALRLANYVYVLEVGRKKFEGPVSEFQDVEKAFWV